MSAGYEAGNAPCCDDCRGRVMCDFSGVADHCTDLQEGNHWVDIAYGMAAQVARVHDASKRDALAHGLAGLLEDHLPFGLVDYDEIVRLAGGIVKRVGRRCA